MQSLQVLNVAPETVADYSPLRVCRSAAGWFVGTLYRDGSPGSRDSCYFKTESDASFALETIKRMYSKVTGIRAKGAQLGVNCSDLSDEEFAGDVAAVLLMCGLDAEEVGYRLHP